MNKGCERLLVRSAGQPLTHESIVKLSFEPESSLYQTENLPIRYIESDTWISDMQLPRNNKTVWKLRVMVERGEQVMVADYPVPVQ